MSQPTPYTRQFNFTNFQTSNPSDPLPGNQIDAELNAVKQTSDQTRVNLAKIQRDDGALANDSVGSDQLKPEVDFGFNVVEDWSVGVNYVVRDGVWFNGSLYRCLIAHTSTVFATDLAASRWQLILNVQAETEAAADTYLAAVTPDYVAANLDRLWPTYSATTAGTAAAYTADFSPAITSYETGRPMVFKVHVACESGATLNANGLGPLPLLVNGSAVTTHVLRPGILYIAVYDGTSIHVTGGAGSGAESVVPAVAAAGATQELNYNLGTVFDLTGTASTACTISFANLPVSGVFGRWRLILRQPAVTGGSTWLFPAAVRWLGRNPQTSPPALSVAAGHAHEIQFFTVDGGTTVFAELSGKELVSYPSSSSGLYIISGSNGKWASSTTGTDFTAQTAFGVDPLRDILYHDGRFHIVKVGPMGSFSNLISYTTNGTSLTAWSNGGGDTPVMKGLSLNSARNMIYVDLNPGGSHYLAYSITNGTTASRFTPQGLDGPSFATFDNIGNVVWYSKGGNYTVAESAALNDPASAVAITHTGYTLANLSCARWLNGYFLVGQTTGQIAYKTTFNATAHTNVTSVIGANPIKGFLWTGAKWIAVAGSGATCNASAIGTWVSRPTGATGDINDIAHANGSTRVVTQHGEIATSTDHGDSWTLTAAHQNPFTGSAIHFIKYRLSRWWAGGDGGKLAQLSDDGATWVLVNADMGSEAIYDFEAA